MTGRRTAVFVAVATVSLATVGASLVLAASTGPAGMAAAATNGSVAAPAAQTTTNDSAATDMTGNNSATSSETLPGQCLSVVIGVQGSETNSEFERRSSGAYFMNVNLSALKAAVVATQVETVHERLAELEQRRDRLEARCENGTLSEGQCRMRLTWTVTDIKRTRSMSNQTVDAASTAPAREPSARGIETAELNRLRTNASELTGPKVVEIARRIAGDPGKGIGREYVANETETGAGGRPDNPGRSDTPGNSHFEASNRATDARADARNATNGAETDGHVTNGTVTDVAGGESDGTTDGTDRGNAPETPPGNGKWAKDTDGSDVVIPPVSERPDDDTIAIDNDTTATDNDTTNDESETLSTDDSGV